MIGAVIRRPTSRVLAIEYDAAGAGRSLGEFKSMRAAMLAFEKNEPPAVC